MSALKAVSVWAVAIILALTAGAFFAAVTATQLTSEGTGERLLRRSVAVMTDIDAALPKIEAELHASAAATEGPTVRVPGFPIAIDLPREEAVALSGPALRERLLSESAGRIYANGMSVWASDDSSAARSIERASTAGLVDRGLGLVRGSVHTAFLVLAVLLGILTVSMAVALVVVLPRDARLLVLGGVVLASALPSLAAAVALRFAFRTAGSDADPFVEGLLDIGADSMWVPIRNFLTLTLLGAGLIGVGAFLLWWEARSMGRHQGFADTGF